LIKYAGPWRDGYWEDCSIAVGNSMPLLVCSYSDTIIYEKLEEFSTSYKKLKVRTGDRVAIKWLILHDGGNSKLTMNLSV
jgi:hypothetical protein